MKTQRNLLRGANIYTHSSPLMVGAGTNSAYFNIYTDISVNLEAGVTYTLSARCTNIDSNPNVYHWGRSYNGSRRGCVSVGLNLKSNNWAEYWIVGGNPVDGEWVYHSADGDSHISGKGRILDDGRMAFTFTAKQTAEYVVRIDAGALGSVGNTAGVGVCDIMVERGMDAYEYAEHRLPINYGSYPNILRGAARFTADSPLTTYTPTNSSAKTDMRSDVYADLVAGQTYTLTYDTNGDTGRGCEDYHTTVRLGMFKDRGLSAYNLQGVRQGTTFSFTPSVSGRYYLRTENFGSFSTDGANLYEGEDLWDVYDDEPQTITISGFVVGQRYSLTTEVYSPFFSTGVITIYSDKHELILKIAYDAAGQEEWSDVFVAESETIYVEFAVDYEQCSFHNISLRRTGTTNSFWNIQLEASAEAHDYSECIVDYVPSDGEMKVYAPNGDPMLIVPLSADAVRTSELMGEDYVKLKWIAEFGLDEDVFRLPLGAYIEIDGDNFRLLAPYTPTQKDEITYQYEPQFLSEITALSTKPFFFYMQGDDGEEQCETEWNLNGEFGEFTQALKNAIYKSTGQSDWSVSCPTNLGTRSLSFSEHSIFDALTEIATAFDCEWIGTKRSIRFVEDATTTDARTLVVGTDIKPPSQNSSDTAYFNRYYAFGSTRNIVRSDYGSLNAAVTSLAEPRLKLPRTSWVDADTGETIEACKGGYVDYADGSGVDQKEINATVLIYDDIYPQSDLTVTNVTQANKKADNGETYPVYTLSMKDNTGEAFTINTYVYNKDTMPNGHLISGLSVSIHFKTGLMQGKEFEVAVSADGKSVTIVPDTSEEIMVPNNIIVPQVGDEVIIFNIRMPDSYRIEAEHRLYKKLLEDIAKAHSTYAQMTIQSNPCGNVEKLSVGEKVEIVNGTTSVTTRIVSVEYHLDFPTEWTITTGDAVRTSKVRAMTESITKLSGTVDVSQKTSVLATRQAYKASQEVINQIFDPEGDFFTDIVKPLVVQTSNVTVGTKSQQFVIENLAFTYDNGYANSTTPKFVAQRVNTSAYAYLRHYAIDPENIRSWRISSSKTYSYGESETILGHTFSFNATTGGCYIYARCPRFDGESASTILNGTLILTDQQILCEPENDTANYYFLIGHLSSEIAFDDDTPDRTITATFGQTTINGRFITSGRIQSADQKTYFDLDRGEISGNITFTAPQGSSNYTLINNLIGNNSSVTTASTNASTAKTNAATALQNANSAKTTATSAQTTATSAQTTATSAQTTATSAQTTANNALTTANTALTKSDGRNYVLGTANPTYVYFPASSYTQYDIKTASVFRDASVKGTFKVTASFIVHGWTESFAPVTNVVLGSNGVGDAWSLRIGFSAYKELSDGGRLYYNTVTVPVGANIGNIWSSGCIKLLCEKNNGTRYPSSGTQAIEHLMIEKGSTYSDWQPAPEDSDYLRESLLEATSGTTDITGGLVLSSFIGVRDNATGNLQAGMNGNATDNTLPMIFSGRVQENGNIVDNGTFRVHASGQVESVSADQQRKMVFDNSTLQFYNGNDNLNRLTSAKAGSIQAMLKDGNALMGSGKVTYSYSGNSTSFSDSAVEQVLGQFATSKMYIQAQSLSIGFPEKKYSVNKLILTPTDDGTLRLTEPVDISAKAKFTYASASSPKWVWYGEGDVIPSGPASGSTGSWNVIQPQVSVSITIGGVKVKQNQINDNYSSFALSIKKGVPVYLVVTITVSACSANIATEGDRVAKYYSQLTTVDGEDYTEEGWWLPRCSIEGSLSITLTGTPVCYTSGQTAYRNSIYANGLMLAESTEKYFGVMPADGSDVFSARSPVGGIGLNQSKGAWLSLKKANNSLTWVGIMSKIAELSIAARNNNNSKAGKILSSSVWANPLGLTFSVTYCYYGRYKVELKGFPSWIPKNGQDYTAILSSPFDDYGVFTNNTSYSHTLFRTKVICSHLSFSETTATFYVGCSIDDYEDTNINIALFYHPFY